MIQDEVDKVLDRYAANSIKLMKMYIKQNRHSSGRLENSMYYDITPTHVVIGMNAYGEAINGSIPGGKPRKKAFIPIEPLTQWVIRKNFKLKGTTGKNNRPITAKMARSKKPVGHNALQQARGIAFAISIAAKKRSGRGLYTGGNTDPFIERSIKMTFGSTQFGNDIREAAQKSIITKIDFEFNKK